MSECDCNTSACACGPAATTVQTQTTTLVTSAYFDDKSFSTLTDTQIRDKIDVVPLNVTSTLILFNKNILNNAAFNKTEYPFVTDRLTQGAITETEYREFLVEYNYTVDTTTETVSLIGQTAGQVQTVFVEGTATKTITNNPRKHMENFNNFLKLTIAGVAVSSLCRFLSDPFNQITSASELFSGFLGGFKSLKDFIAGLNNPLDALSGLASSLKQFANSLIGSIGDIVNAIKDKISNIAESVSAAIKKIIGLQGKNRLSLNTWFAKQFANLQNSLSDLNIANMVESISTKIAEAVKGFGTLTIDAIEFLLFTFCKMATAVENNLMSLIDPIKNAFKAITTATAALALGSADNLRKSVESGRPVVEPTVLQEQCEAYIRQLAASSATSANPNLPAYATGDNSPIIVPSDFSKHPLPSAWSNLSWSGQVTNNQFFVTHGDLRMVDDGGYIVNVKSKGISPAIGYYGLHLNGIEKLNEVGRIMGLTLNVNSGYRHPYYNQHLRNTMSGVAKNSNHMSGIAIDVSIAASSSRRLEFLILCKKVGFRGFGYYNTFTHVDMGDRRQWNTGLGDRRFSP
tara:strand:- start:1946 stop:3664 length:1719 start_codon:yes stop_codon:yes gene_type:complete